MFQVTYWIPTRETVNRHIRTASDDPLIKGVPLHAAVFSIAGRCSSKILGNEMVNTHVGLGKFPSERPGSAGQSPSAVSLLEEELKHAVAWKGALCLQVGAITIGVACQILRITIAFKNDVAHSPAILFLNNSSWLHDRSGIECFSLPNSILLHLKAWTPRLIS